MLFMLYNEQYHTVCNTQFTNYHTGTTWCTTIRKSLSASKWLEPILDPEFIIWDRSEFSQECHVSEFCRFFQKFITKYSNLTPCFWRFWLENTVPRGHWFGRIVHWTRWPFDLSSIPNKNFGLFLPLPNKTWDFNMFKLKFPFLFRVIFFCS